MPAPASRSVSAGVRRRTCCVVVSLTLGVLRGAPVAEVVTLPAPRPPAVVRFKDNPIIRHDMLPGPAGTNICYPSLIRMPGWLPNPLGKYYLYFADHKGAYIRLAYANHVEGPWTIHEPGTLKLEQMLAVARAASPGKEAKVEGKHIASPDVHVDDEGGRMPLGAPTNQGMQQMPRPLFRDVRDPCIFRDEGKTYLLYSVAGEGGIAGALLRD